MGGELRLDGAEKVPGELLGDLLEWRHVAAKDLRPVVRPRQPLRRRPLELGAVRADQVVEVLLRDRLGADLELPARGDDEDVERVGRGEVLDRQRPRRQPLRELRDRLRVDGLLLHELGAVARVAREEGLDLREVLALGLRELPRQLLDPLRPLLVRDPSPARPGAPARGERSRPFFSPTSRATRRASGSWSVGRAAAIVRRDEQGLLGLDRGQRLELVPLRRVALVKAQEDARQRVEHRQAVGGLEILGPGLLAGQVPGQAPDDRRGLVSRRPRPRRACRSAREAGRGGSRCASGSRAAHLPAAPRRPARGSPAPSPASRVSQSTIPRLLRSRPIRGWVGPSAGSAILRARSRSFRART